MFVFVFVTTCDVITAVHYIVLNHLSWCLKPMQHEETEGTEVSEA
jgi:hypothetical protein